MSEIQDTKKAHEAMKSGEATSQSTVMKDSLSGNNDPTANNPQQTAATIENNNAAVGSHSDRVPTTRPRADTAVPTMTTLTPVSIEDELRHSLLQFFVCYSPERLPEIPQLLREYGSKKTELLLQLRREFNQVPVEKEASNVMKLDMRTRLFVFYAYYNPSRIEDVDSILFKYPGQEAELWVELERKYGPEPPLHVLYENWKTHDGKTAQVQPRHEAEAAALAKEKRASEGSAVENVKKTQEEGMSKSSSLPKERRGVEESSEIQKQPVIATHFNQNDQKWRPSESHANIVLPAHQHPHFSLNHQAEEELPDGPRMLSKEDSMMDVAEFDEFSPLNRSGSSRRRNNPNVSSPSSFLLSPTDGGSPMGFSPTKTPGSTRSKKVKFMDAMEDTDAFGQIEESIILDGSASGLYSPRSQILENPASTSSILKSKQEHNRSSVKSKATQEENPLACLSNEQLDHRLECANVLAKLGVRQESYFAPSTVPQVPLRGEDRSTLGTSSDSGNYMFPKPPIGPASTAKPTPSPKLSAQALSMMMSKDDFNRL